MHIVSMISLALVALMCAVGALHPRFGTTRFSVSAWAAGVFVVRLRCLITFRVMAALHQLAGTLMAVGLVMYGAGVAVKIARGANERQELHPRRVLCI